MSHSTQPYWRQHVGRVLRFAWSPQGRLLSGLCFSLLLIRVLVSSGIASSGVDGIPPHQNSAPVLRTRGAARGGSPHLPKLLSENSVPLPHIVSDGIAARRLCMLTREFRGLANGGIGTAMAELAEVLASEGVPVTVVLTEQVDTAALSRVHKQLAGLDIDIISNPKVDVGYPIKGDGAQWRSYALFSWLKAFQGRCYTVLYHEWEGVGFHVATAKHQGTDFKGVHLVAVLHGPHLWALHNQRNPPRGVADLHIDFMERRSVQFADVVFAPSRYIVEFVRLQGWQLPDDSHVFVLPNPLSEASLRIERPAAYEPGNKLLDPGRDSLVGLSAGLISRDNAGGSVATIRELVFFGKTDRFKGIDIFCDAVDLLLRDTPELLLGSASGDFSNRGVGITFLARTKDIDGMSGEDYLRMRSKPWLAAGVRVTSIINRNPDECRAYLGESGKGRVAVMPSVLENSPYVVLECLEAGVPFLASDVGGTRELIHPDDAAAVLVSPTATSYAAAFLRTLTSRGDPPFARPFRKMAEIRQSYAEYFRLDNEAPVVETDSAPSRCTALLGSDRPVVTIVITTFNRGEVRKYGDLRGGAPDLHKSAQPFPHRCFWRLFTRLQHRTGVRLRSLLLTMHRQEPRTMPCSSNCRLACLRSRVSCASFATQ